MAHPKGLSFADLKQLCALTDGNLSRHLQVLQEAGLVEVIKGYEGNRPHTTCRLTKTGRKRFLDYLAVLEQLVRDAAKAAGKDGKQDTQGGSFPALAHPARVNFLTGDFAMQSGLAAKPEPEQTALQPALHDKLHAKLHVGIIMDGNGRWAKRQRLPRLRGHEAGVEAIRRVVEAAPEHGVGTLTLYAFSSDNWRRPPAEVSALMGLLRFYLANEIESLVRNGVRLRVIGRRDRLPDGIADAIGDAEMTTADGDALNLRIAIDYSARDAILNAALEAASRHGRLRDLTRETFTQLVTGEAAMPRRRSDHPHQRREAAVRFPALGKRLCRTLFHRDDVAGLRRRTSRRSLERLPWPRTPLRRIAGATARSRGRTCHGVRRHLPRRSERRHQFRDELTRPEITALSRPRAGSRPDPMTKAA